jgi:hypothetical protein
MSDEPNTRSASEVLVPIAIIVAKAEEMSLPGSFIVHPSDCSRHDANHRIW